MTQFMRPSGSSSYTDGEGSILTGMPPKDSVKPGKSVEYPDNILPLNTVEKIVTPDLKDWIMRCMQSSNWYWRHNVEPDEAQILRRRC
ncbi:hypothetical protein ISCGN_018512 [Ixodes scapularis]